MQKRCTKCGGVFALTLFYTHPDGGFRSQCKECFKSGAIARSKNRDRSEAQLQARSEYERERRQRPERLLASRRYKAIQRQRHPERERAHIAIRNAIRYGRMLRQPCRICGAKAEGHHADYSKPLEVDWLCFKHHREIGHGQKVVAGSHV
jgi:hypothetical protein